jgi:hypothetical protein
MNAGRRGVRTGNCNPPVLFGSGQVGKRFNEKPGRRPRGDSQISANVSECWSETEVDRGVRDTAGMGGKSRSDADVFSRSTSDLKLRCSPPGWSRRNFPLLSSVRLLPPTCHRNRAISKQWIYYLQRTSRFCRRTLPGGTC